MRERKQRAVREIEREWTFDDDLDDDAKPAMRLGPTTTRLCFLLLASVSGEIRERSREKKEDEEGLGFLFNREAWGRVGYRMSRPKKN